jgi:hypothetical protein
MKIEIEIDNLMEFSKALQNSLIAYTDIRNAIWIMGCCPEGVDPKWEKLINQDATNMNEITSIFDKRIIELKNVLKQIEQKEKELNE